MSSSRLLRGFGPILAKSQPTVGATPNVRPPSSSRAAAASPQAHAHTHALAPHPRSLATWGLRPRLRSPPVGRLPRLAPPPWQRAQSRRTIFIQTESTPNADALKFLPNHRVLPEGVTSPFVEYLSPRATIAPPYPSPLAAQLMSVDGVTAVFYGADFITVTKAGDANWAHIRPEVFALITETITSGQPLVNVASQQQQQQQQEEVGQGGEASSASVPVRDSLSYDENDSEVVGMIKELLETRIRPAIQEDGGDIEFRGFQNGYVLLKLRGACRTCDSSTVTLKTGIEGMLMHYIEEVQGVHQVLDKEEEIALEEFAKFEEKLKALQGGEARRGGQAPPSTG